MPRLNLTEKVGTTPTLRGEKRGLFRAGRLNALANNFDIVLIIYTFLRSHPSNNSWMHSWLCDHSLHSDTMVRYGDGETFLRLSSLVPNCQKITMADANPFDLQKDDLKLVSGAIAALE